MDIGELHLVLFLSRATSLGRWNKLGILEREFNYYRKLREKLAAVSLVSCGGKEEQQFQDQLGDIELLYNKWGLSPNLYSLLAAFLHRSALRKAHIYKSNQLDGAWTAVVAGKLYKKPVIVRAGYLWSESSQRVGDKGIKPHLIQILQSLSLRKSTSIIVTTREMKEKLVNRYQLPEVKISVVPNYVDIELFKPPVNRHSVPGRLCFVGRLASEKNLPVLLRAASQIPGASLIIIGEGSQRAELGSLAKKQHITAVFPGIMPNSELPEIITSAEVFILPSLFEGHPKALIEAMACGLPVIGTDVPGIRELLVHRQTGLLCLPEIDSLREAIQSLLGNQALQKQLGENARRFVVDHYSLPRVLEHEIAGIESTLERYGHS